MGADDSRQRWQYKVAVRPPLYNCIKERDTPLTVLTALPLHRIFKAQFHTIAVGVSVRGILKKKAIKHQGVHGSRQEGGEGAAMREREETHSTGDGRAEKPREKLRSRGGGPIGVESNGTMEARCIPRGVPLSTPRCYARDYYSLCNVWSRARDRARKSVCTRTR